MMAGGNRLYLRKASRFIEQGESPVHGLARALLDARISGKLDPLGKKEGAILINQP